MAKNLKKEERKKQIKQAAIKLMSKKGYTNTSVQNILDEIHYSKGGFYNCYASKDELFKDIFKDGMDERYKRIQDLKGLQHLGTNDFLIEGTLDKIIDYNEYKGLFSTFAMEMATDDDFLKFFKENMNEMSVDALDFFEKEGLEEFKPLFNEEFSVFLTSLMIGVNTFKKYNDENYRNFLREVIRAYFEKAGLIRISN